VSSSSSSATGTDVGAAASADVPDVGVRAAPWILGLVVSFVVGVEWVWLARDPLPDVTGDDAGIARCVFALLAWWRDGVPYRPELLAGAPYPPLAVQLGAVGAWAADAVGGDPVLGMLRGQSAYLAALVVGAWASLRREGGVAVATAAALVAPVYGWWAYRGQMFVDMQLGACLVAAMGAWAASDGLRRPWPAFLFGVSLAAALLTKFSAVFFAAVPASLAVAFAVAGLCARGGASAGGATLVGAAAVIAGAAAAIPIAAAVLLSLGAATVVVLQVRRAPTSDVRARLRSLALVGGGLAMAAPWYLTSLDVLRAFLASNLEQQYDGVVYPVVYVWWVYPVVLFRGAVDEAVTVLALAGVLRLRRAGLGSVVWFAVAMVAVGCVSLTLQPYRTPRYIVPLAAPVAVLAVSSVLWGRRAAAPTALAMAALGAWIWGRAPFGHPTREEDASAWYRRVAWVPPNAPQALAQQRQAAFDPRPRLHRSLPAPSRSPFAFPLLTGALLENLDLAAVRSVEVSGGDLPAWACSSLGLRLVSLGADPYLRCGGGAGAQVRVTPETAAPAALVQVGGPFDVQRLYVYAAPGVLRRVGSDDAGG
jgi:hypothetical protein